MSFDDSNSAGNKIIAESLQSPNYAMGSSGWTINRDGSAEFQNVLVRGTITASTINGSTINGGTINGTIVNAGALYSQNYSYTGHTGFGLNGTAVQDSYGTPANTIAIYSNFYVGPPTGAYVQLAYSATQGLINLSSGAVAQTAPAMIFAQNVANPLSGTAEPSLFLESPSTGAGTAEMALIPAVSGAEALALFQTSGTTTVAGVNGVMSLGNASDQWTLVISNENTSGTTGGLVGLVIGKDYSGATQSRLFVSVNEIFTVNGSSVVEPLYLNENNNESVYGSVAAKGMRPIWQRDTSGHTITTTTFATVGTISIVFQLPASGNIIATYKADLTANSATQTFQVDCILKNTTASTTPYGGSGSNCAKWNGTVPAGGTSPNGLTVGGFVMLGPASGQGGTLGNAGDSMTLTIACAVTGGSATVSDLQLMMTPSL